jgi:hypothetical protein
MFYVHLMQVRMMTSIDDLPDEMLLRIFQYLPAEHLPMTVPAVSARWKDLSQRNTLWKNVTFTPPITMSEEEVAYALQTMPRLQSFRLKHGENIDYIVDSLCLYCPDIRHIVMERKRGPTFDRVLKIVTLYRDIDSLDVLVPGAEFQIDFAKFYPIQRTRPFSLAISNAVSAKLLEKIFGKVRLGDIYMKPPYDDVEHLLNSRRCTLKYMSFTTMIITSVEMYMISKCKHLKQLYLCSEGFFVTVLDLNLLTELQNLECFQLCILHLIEIHGTLVTGREMLRLVKLEIVCKCSVSNESIAVMFKLCPNLQHVKVQTRDLKDESLTTISGCQRLKHIDISFNQHLTDMSVAYIAMGCSELEFLDVSSCSSMTEEIVNTLSSLTHIEELRLDQQNFSAQCLFSIPTLLPNVSAISVRGCIQLCPADIERLESTYPHVKCLRDERMFVDRMLCDPWYDMWPFCTFRGLRL